MTERPLTSGAAIDSTPAKMSAIPTQRAVPARDLSPSSNVIPSVLEPFDMGGLLTQGRPDDPAAGAGEARPCTVRPRV
jgi:hypothetical protein